ncbi:flagellar basal body-associated FliL family protein [Pseudoxanthomonas taiwanensis]|uniref:Flagellar protein FliL n=1 Tax=Pseudoxanthomonas taiwanensis TaxID=176598 RepID=A0A921TDF7_9GAMM|nr:flagellar basal body-associated FliL family protein [Pseudoxanthomonas taiwanensis]KAF1688335.1 flagellar basal body protein FliL [Pseudoxanthomonas taiwanensis]
MPAPADKTSRSQPAKATAPAQSGGGLRSKLPTILSALALLVAAVSAAGWFISSRKAPEPAAAPAAAGLPAQAQYMALEPPFVVNLAASEDGPHYLQVEIQLVTRDTNALANLERHAPAIRARLLMLLAQQSAADIADRAGKERLQKEALEEVQKLMRAETGNPSAEDLLFTSFVTQ